MKIIKGNREFEAIIDSNGKLTVTEGSESIQALAHDYKDGRIQLDFIGVNENIMNAGKPLQGLKITLDQFDEIEKMVEEWKHKNVPVKVKQLNDDYYRLVSGRTRKADWPSGAFYMSRDWLEDMDIFLTEPAWRLATEDVEHIKQRGYKVEIDTLEDQEKRKEKAEREKKEKEEKEENEKQAEIERYAAWREEKLAGYVETTLVGQEFYQSLNLEKVAYFNEKAGWYTTGDTWYCDKKKDVFINSFGNARVAWIKPEMLVSITAECIEKSVQDPSENLVVHLIGISDYSKCYYCDHYNEIKNNPDLRHAALTNFRDKAVAWTETEMDANHRRKIVEYYTSKLCI